MTIKISIIVPCYNQAKYLNDCLDSVLKQSFRNWECIIVNDGSPDNTVEIATKWTERDSRFSLLNKPNGGPSSARNAGIVQSKGEFILPLDSDDKISPDYIKLALKEFEKYPILKLVYCDAVFFGEKRGPCILPLFDFKTFLQGNCIFASAIFRKEHWKAIGGYDENLIFGLEDWEFYINLLSNMGAHVKKMNHIGFFYRQVAHNSVSSYSGNKKKVNWNKSYIRMKHWKLYRLDKVIRACFYIFRKP